MYEFSCGRSSPVEGPTQNAKTAAERERTNQLAQPKKVHPEHQASREVSRRNLGFELEVVISTSSTSRLVKKEK